MTERRHRPALDQAHIGSPVGPQSESVPRKLGAPSESANNRLQHPFDQVPKCARMLRPGGEMILLSRIGADGGFRHLVERLLQPIVCRLGWRAEFPWDRFALWTERRTDVRLIERRPMPPLGHFSLLRFVKCGQEAGA